MGAILPVSWRGNIIKYGFFCVGTPYWTEENLALLIEEEDIGGDVDHNDINSDNDDSLGINSIFLNLLFLYSKCLISPCLFNGKRN